MKYISRIVCYCICIIFLTDCTIMAQSPPDSGTILRQQRQPGVTLPDRLPSDREKESLSPPATDSGVRVLVKGFRFTGGDGIATGAELQELVRDSVGLELGFSDLKIVASMVTNYLREKKGYLLARAYLPKQDITEGIIEIAIISGRIEGKVGINIKEPGRIKPSLLEGIAARAIPADSPARLEQIERAVLLINDLPGINSRASLEPGAKPGSTRVVINAAEGNIFRGALSGDNYGDRFTGALRTTGQLSTYDPFGFGDQLNLSFILAERLTQWRAFYALPLGSTCFNWNTSYTGLTYELGKDLKDLNAKGRADSMYTGISYPLVRSRNASIWAGAGFEYMTLEDEANRIETSDRELPLGEASVSGTFYDTFYGGGLTSAAISLTGGDADLSGNAANKTIDDAGPGTHGNFMRANYSLARLQRLTRHIALYGSARGQFASGNLDSSQKFILGGPTGIRAYPVGEAPGDEGHAVTLETRFDLPFMPSWATAQFIGFFDTGWIKLHRDTWPGSVTNAGNENDYLLSGCGAGINMGKPGLYNIRAFYAHKIGPNYGKSLSGKDADNLSDGGRFWLQLVIWI